MAAILIVAIVEFGCQNRQVQTLSAPVFASLSTDSPPTALKTCTFTLSFPRTSPLAGDPQSLSLNLTMQSMFMPPNPVVMHRTAPGIYTGTGIFTMGGIWTASGKVRDSGRQRVIGPFTIAVKD